MREICNIKEKEEWERKCGVRKKNIKRWRCGVPAAAAGVIVGNLRRINFVYYNFLTLFIYLNTKNKSCVSNPFTHIYIYILFLHKYLIIIF